MPFTSKAPADDTPYPPMNGEVNGWPFRVLGSGEVFVGTSNTGKFKKFKFWLTRYEDSTDPAACVLDEIEDRRSDERPSIQCMLIGLTD